MPKKKVVFSGLPGVRLSGYVPTFTSGRETKAIYVTLDTAQMQVTHGIVVEIDGEPGEEATLEETGEALAKLLDEVWALVDGRLDKMCSDIQDKVSQNRRSPYGRRDSQTTL